MAVLAAADVLRSRFRLDLRAPGSGELLGRACAGLRPRRRSSGSLGVRQFAAGRRPRARRRRAGLPPKGDVSDFLESHTIEELLAIVDATPLYTPSVPSAAPSTAEDFNLTDSGNAEYFASERGGELRYDTRRDRWLQYRKHRWGVIDKTVVLKLGRDTVRQRQIDALKIESPSKKAEHTKWALRSESRTRIDSMIYLSRGQPAIWDDGKNWDADPLLLGVANGIVDLRTGALRDGRPDDRVTQHCAVKYDANARCPRWERFLREVFEPYPELVPFIQCAVGYSLTGETG